MFLDGKSEYLTKFFHLYVKHAIIHSKINPLSISVYFWDQLELFLDSCGRIHIKGKSRNSEKNWRKAALSNI